MDLESTKNLNSYSQFICRMAGDVYTIDTLLHSPARCAARALSFQPLGLPVYSAIITGHVRCYLHICDVSDAFVE